MERWLWVAACLAAGCAVPLPHEVDSEQTRKLLGSSVVTSVSVIMDHGNGTKTYITDGDGEKKPQVVGTPGTLLSPDRYEFYSFGEDGELVKKLMTLDQIQSLIAGGDELDSLPVYEPQPLIDNTHTEGVHKVLESVQNVLKGELQAAKVHPKLPMPLPDDSWSILLPGLLNSDLDLKETHMPPKTETSTAKTNLLSQDINKDPTSTRRPIQSTTVRSTSRPTSQTTMSQQTSTMHFTQAQQSTKPFSESRPTATYSTSPPFVKTTTAANNKQPSQKPQTTSKKPILSTKRPYVSETPMVKVSLASTQKLESTTKPTTTSKMPTTVIEERIPSTKFPEMKKPIPEKQKPSGIPTITHYMPISSMSPSSSTLPSLTEPTTPNQKFSSTSKEPLRVTTTKRPSTFSTSQMTTQKVTKRPVQNKIPSTNNKTQTINTSQNEKVTSKNPKPTLSTTTTTRIQNATTTAAPTTTSVKATTVPIVTKEQLSTSTEKLETRPETEPELMSTTPMPGNSPISLDQEKYVSEKHSGLVPLSNLIGENSNIVNTKVNPSASSIVMSTTPNSSEKVASSSTPFPEKFTTFSYTSKITPNGEIITMSQPAINYTQDKSTSGSSFQTTLVYTKLPTTVNIRTTEKPLERVTPLPQQSSKPIEAVRDQILVSSSMQPTTYHPHNFSFPSEKNQVPILSSTTPISTTTVTQSSTEDIKKHNIVTDLPITEQPSSNSTYPIHSSMISNSSTISSAADLQSITKSTTLPDNPGETTMPATTPISSALSETSINDSTTYTTEEMPLQEIPLKIYESLKDNVSGAQELLTTIMSENLSTTPAKVENVYSTDYDVTAPTTTTTTDKMTTILDVVSSTMIPQNNFVIINNSEPQILEKNALPFISENEVNSTTTNEPTQFSTETPNDRNSSTYESTSQDEATTFPTTVPANNSDLENLETTPNLDSTTIYKDHIVQEGISAVTSILLDQAQKQQAMKQAILATAIKNDDILDMERMRTTTEDERMTTTMSDSTETSTGKFSIDGDQMKSEVRQDEDAELPEKFTTLAVEITTQSGKLKTETQAIKDELKISNNVSNNKEQLTKNEQKSTSVVPTKESKLNPDTDHGHMKKTSNKYAENTPLLRTSPLPEFTATTERLKLSELEKPVPKPLSPFAKKPSSVYQSLDNLPPVAIELNPAPYESMGLEASIAFLGEDVRRFADLCNELAFKLWTSITGKGQIASRSLVMSPFAVTSLLAMVFLGARGPTSGQMNDVLRLDDMVTFNPHQVLQNVTESVINSKTNGVATAAFVRELYSDKTKGKILDFYKERVQQYYQGHVEEVTFTTIGDIIRRRTNLLVKRQTLGKVPEYLRGSSLNMRPPLAAFSANIFQTDCEHGSTEGRDGEMYFVVRPSTRQRRLVPVPAVVWRSGFLAGYEPSLDATSVCLGPESVVSTILILPGQQGQVAPGDGLARLEQRLIETTYRRGGWSQILRSLMPRPGLELQIPRFSHRSVLNMTGALQRMGLRDLFNARRADLRGLNGLSNDLHLSDMLQVNTFSTCGEESIGARHHVETYPASPQRIGRDETDHHSARDLDNAFGDLHLSLRPRQARLPDNPRLRFDRPFLYMVRHNPSGMILHMGRFNPRLLP